MGSGVDGAGCVKQRGAKALFLHFFDTNSVDYWDGLLRGGDTESLGGFNCYWLTPQANPQKAQQQDGFPNALDSSMEVSIAIEPLKSQGQGNDHQLIKRRFG